MRFRRFLPVMLVMLLAPLAGCGADSQPGDIEVGETVTTASGLEFELLEAGGGDNPRPGDIVIVDYVAMLEDGTMVDSSMFQGEAATFQLGQGQVILGWEEGILMMRVGDRAQLTIPPELAYGAEGNPPMVPPNATMIFDLTLLAIEDA